MSESTSVERQFYRVSEFAQCIGCGETFIRGLIRAKRLRSVKIGGVVLIPVEEIQRWKAAANEDTREIKRGA
jgi:excisionase family DNA binding protein